MLRLPVDNCAVRVWTSCVFVSIAFSIRTKHACGASRRQLEMQSGPLSWHPGWRIEVWRRGNRDCSVNVIALRGSPVGSKGPHPLSVLDTFGKNTPILLSGQLMLSILVCSLFCSLYHNLFWADLYEKLYKMFHNCAFYMLVLYIVNWPKALASAERLSNVSYIIMYNN